MMLVPVLLVVVVVALFVCALRPVADALLRPLEQQHPPLDLEALLRQSGSDGARLPRFVVVLAAGDRHHRPELPATAQLQPTGLMRLVEGVRIIQRLPQAHLVACAFESSSREARSPIVDAARELGVDRVTLVSSSDRPSTRSELQALTPLVASNPFVLVTTAAHMPRAVEVCRSLALHPLPAPTDFMARRRSAFGLRAWRPTIQALIQSERALYEYAAWCRRRLSSRG